MTILAIDPGLSGGIAYTHPDGTFHGVQPMPDTEPEIFRFLLSVAYSPCTIFIEEVPWILSSGAKHNAAGRAKLHANTGFIRGVFAYFANPIRRVRPQDWQKSLGLQNVDRLSYSEWKKHLKEKAQALYPRIKVTLKTADALLILEYGRRQLSNPQL